MDAIDLSQKKMRRVKWEGVYPAVTTKFSENGQIDIPAFLSNIEAQVKAGVQGIVIGGSLGESSSLTQEERLALLRATLERFGNFIDVILNVAEGSTETAVQLVQKATQAGAHGFMLLPPMMYKATDEEVVAYFIAIAAATKLPIMVYNNPVDYKNEITLDMLAALSAIDNIQAIKESTRDVSNVLRIRNRFGKRFKILCGVDTIAMESMLMGADGWVAGLVCAFPEETMRIYRLIQTGDIEKALEIYQWFLPLLELDIDPQLVQNIKLAESFTGLGNENVRLPRQPLQGAKRESVIQVLEHALATRPDLDFELIA